MNDAVKAARAYVQAGKRVVVDVDLAKFFDRVNHDILIDRLQRAATLYERAGAAPWAALADAALRKQVVIVTPEGKFTHLKAAPSALTNPVARVLIAQRWPGASILNNDTNAADRLAAEYWREAMVAQQQETARHA